MKTRTNRKPLPLAARVAVVDALWSACIAASKAFDASPTLANFDAKVATFAKWSAAS
jgi:hypothetical protein